MKFAYILLAAVAIAALSYVFLQIVAGSMYATHVYLLLDVVMVAIKIVIAALFLMLSRKLGGQLSEAARTIGVAFVFIAAGFASHLYVEHIEAGADESLYAFSDTLLVLGAAVLFVGAYAIYKSIDSTIVPKVGTIRKLV